MKIVAKPWGKEIWFAHNPRYAGKLLCIRKGHRLSLQYHKVKHETLYALQGTCLLTLGKKKVRLKPGRAAVIPPHLVHRMDIPQLILADEARLRR